MKKSAFKMKGFPYAGKSPIEKKVDLTKKTGLGPRENKKESKWSDDDVYERAMNDFDIDEGEPTKKQLEISRKEF